MGKFIKTLTYSWWKYLLVITLSTFVWQMVFGMMESPDKNEKIRITYIGENLSCEDMETELYRVVDERTDQKIKNITVENPVNGGSTYYHSLLATRVYGSDFIIIEESSLLETMGETYFSEIPSAKLEQYIEDVEYYCENGVPYGLLLYDGTTENQFSRYYTGTEKCYLFITHTTVNFADVVENGNATDDAALRILEYFMEEH